MLSGSGGGESAAKGVVEWLHTAGMLSRDAEVGSSSPAVRKNDKEWYGAPVFSCGRFMGPDGVRDDAPLKDTRMYNEQCDAFSAQFPHQEKDVHQIDFEQDLKLGNTLGVGGFGSVHEGTYRGKKVAMKVFQKYVSVTSGVPCLAIVLYIRRHVWIFLKMK
jgi:hypothetical protein